MSITLPYQIKYRDEIIAEFLHEFDRGTCLDALENEHPDCEFETCEEEKF